MNQQLPQSRRVRRQSQQQSSTPLVRPGKVELPGPLRIIANPKFFAVMALIFIGGMTIGLLPGALGGSSTTGNDVPEQSNEVPDVARDEAGNVTTPPVVPTVTVKRYTAAPAVTIDTTKRYLATITTTQGPIQIELYPDQAPEAVNAFIFLAQDGYYNNTAFMQLAKNLDGSKFYTQAGDPTRTGLGTPGFSIKKELTALPFSRGAVGMGGSAADSNGGQFFISYGEYPTLNGKYTIFGKVVSGLDVLDRLSLVDLTPGASSTGGDQIQSVTITPQ